MTGVERRAAATSLSTVADPALAGGAAWIEGELVPVEEARIPILDTGFVRSDLTYDVVSVWRGSFFRLDDHLARFQRNWTRVRLSPPFGRDEIRALLIDMVRRSGLRDAYVAMILTRGVPAPGERDPRSFRNRFYAYAVPFVWIQRPDQQAAGTHLVIARDTIRIPPTAVDPTVKNFHWGDLVRGLYEAYDRGGALGALTDGNGNVTEGPGFNVFALVDGVLRTPADGVFDGMTRRTLIELVQEEGAAPLQLGPLPVAELARASEVFLSSTAGGVMPVTTLDGATVGDGRPGELTRRLQARYWLAHEDPRFATPVTR
ncbi:aminotransferase class IV [Conexibacter sp. CPCC 206217]|uniref:aminotransferase class IV n=1 Tax=Conexibacter sp. CPCC 206217 TaxID=3064574 RepID=UPI002725FCF7|nr:aminotransferase class IV [Conexibacter sp. CPCC 206217]MDO8211738.1 aminotransferase class IV [Conexibacter sp. CPCC 206217]